MPVPGHAEHHSLYSAESPGRQFFNMPKLDLNGRVESKVISSGQFAMQLSDRSQKYPPGSRMISPLLEHGTTKVQLPDIQGNTPAGTRSVMKKESKPDFKVKGRRISTNGHSLSVAKFKKKSLTKFPSKALGAKESRVSMIV